MRSNHMHTRAGWICPALMCLAVLLCLDPGRAGAVQDLPASFSSLVKKAAPGVVNIMATKVVKPSNQEPSPFEPGDPFKDFFDRYFGNRMPREYRQGTLGTGFLIDAKGMILTNNHMVDSATSIKVTLADGSTRDAKVIGTDPETDLALINIGAVPDSDVAKLGDSDKIRIGDWAIAMGNPMNLDWTLTVGVISAKGRTNLNIEGGGPTFQDFIQTDASINFGNSGGPLADIHGEVIGINAAINANAQNIGFAIPINLAKQVVAQLEKNGKVSRGYLGMVPQELTSLMREALNLDDNTEGIFVSSVQKETPAEKGGLQASDVITAIDGKPVKDVRDFRFRVAAHAPGDKMKLTVLRDGKKKTLDFVLGNRDDYVTDNGGEQKMGEKKQDTWMGLTVAPLSSPYAQRLNIDRDNGVLVIKVDDDSPAAGQLNPGDVIVQVDQKPVNDIHDWSKITDKLGDTDRAVLVKFYPRGSDLSRFVALKKE